MTENVTHRCRSCGVTVYIGDEWTYCSGGSQFCYNSGPNPSKMLRWAKDAGLKIVCSVAPYEGREVVYDSGYSGTHPRPWVLLGTGLRFSGKECLALPLPPVLQPSPPSSRGFLSRITGRWAR
jgi:hypothetical protein